MQSNNVIRKLFALTVVLVLVLSACATAAPEPTATNTPQPTATKTTVPTATFTPTRTPKPTITPNLAATQQYEEYEAEIQSYVDAGYLTSAEGITQTLNDYSHDWAQLGWYDMDLIPVEASNFALSGHFKWSSAYRNADISGCGFVFSLQENGDHYAVFLDRSKVVFLITSNQRGRFVSPTRGTGVVKFENPFDKPAEADFTIVVNDNYAYVLVDGELVGEYTLAQSRGSEGLLARTVLSGTNKDFGTRCEMTKLHVWTPE